MHISIRLITAVGLLFCLGNAKTAVKIKVEKSLIFETKDSEYYLDSLIKGDEVYLLQESPDKAKIKTRSGTVGWVSKSEIEYVNQSQGQSYSLENQDVRGWLDNPQALYILDQTDMGAEAMLLTRTFEREFFEFLDREILERRNDEN